MNHPGGMNLCAIAIIKAHAPNLTDEDEEEISRRWVDSDDVSDSAIRTCSCGLRLEGFYAYQDHLLTLLGGEPVTGGQL